MPRKPKPSFDNLDDRNRDETDAMEIFMAAMRKLFTEGIPVATGDLSIGAVELKNSNTDSRANVLAANTVRTTGTIVLAVQHVDAAGNVLPASPVLGAGTASIGTVKDGGCGLTTSFGVTGARFTSADQSGSAASITDAPTSGQKLVLTDIILSSDTALRLDLKEETSGTILASIYLGAGTTVNVVTRGKLKLATADKKLQIQASAAGNISATAIYYSEA